MMKYWNLQVNIFKQIIIAINTRKVVVNMEGIKYWSGYQEQVKIYSNIVVWARLNCEWIKMGLNTKYIILQCLDKDIIHG